MNGIQFDHKYTYDIWMLFTLGSKYDNKTHEFLYQITKQNICQVVRKTWKAHMD